MRIKIKSFAVLLLIFTFICTSAFADAPGLIYKEKCTGDDGYTYRLQRVHDGIPVLNEGVYITFDKEGNLIYLSDDIGEGEFEKAAASIDLKSAVNNIPLEILRPLYIYDGKIYRYVFKPAEFAVDARTGGIIAEGKDMAEVEGDSDIDWEYKDVTGDLEKILGQAGYSYKQSFYKEFNGAADVTYISGSKSFGYINLAIHEDKPIYIAFSAFNAASGGDDVQDAGVQNAIDTAERLYRELVPKGNISQMSCRDTERDYTIDFVRTQDGVPVEDNGFYVAMSKDGNVKSINYRWDHTDFERIPKIDKEGILSNYIEAAQIGLYYKKTGNRYIPVYAASKDIDYITPQGTPSFRSL